MPYKTPEEQRARNQRYLAEHREENKARCKANYEAHKEERKQKMRERHAANREEENAKRREWTRTHPEEAAKTHRNYYQSHKEEQSAHKKAYNKAHPEKQRERNRNYVRTHRKQNYEYVKRKTAELKEEVFTHYGNGKCACVKCGYDEDLRGLVLDHINGNGAQHRKALKKTGRAFYALLKRTGYPAGFQTLCAICNNIKVDEENEHKAKYASKTKEKEL